MSILWMIVLFVIMLYLFTWLFTKTKTLSSYTEASESKTFTSDKLTDPASLSYSYSVWIYMSSWNTGTKKNVFRRKLETASTFSPEVYLDSQDNQLKVGIQYSSTNASGTSSGTNITSVTNIPIQTWTNIIVSLNSRVLDVYVNGKLMKTSIIPGDPISYKTGDVELTPSTSFTGYTSRFIYSPNPMGPEDAWNTYKNGPSGNILMTFLNQYKIKLSFLKGSEDVASITI
jgi:hypothetical protein